MHMISVEIKQPGNYKRKNMKNITTVIILLFVHACIYAQSAGSNKKTAKQNTNPLAGTWRLIEFTDLDSLTGKWVYRYGKNPRGYFTYTKTNIVNLNISTDTPSKISEDSAKKLNVNPARIFKYGFIRILWNLYP